MRNKILVGAGMTAFIAAWAAKDPVVMTVNGVDVPRSEFEYLYHKNSKQQLTPQPLEEYAEMFRIYKLKVADAKASGLDTLETFRNEMAQYRRELAEPYMADSLLIDTLVEETLARSREDVETSHIMMFKTRDLKENRRHYAQLDSIRGAILGGADFTEMAKLYSQDPSVKRNDGNLGYITAGRYPYNFETAAYTVAEGEVSEIVESPAGYHIVKPGKRRPSRGKVEVSHIMTMAGEAQSPAEQERAKELIDSIYSVVAKEPGQFADLARRYSADPGSARQGGKLPAFGPGEMVPEFEELSYRLRDGEIGGPVKSRYGWHIIQKHSSFPAPDRETIKGTVMQRLSNPNDGMHKRYAESQKEKLGRKHKLKEYESVREAMEEEASVNGIDSLFMARWIGGAQGKQPLFSIDGKNVAAREFVEEISQSRGMPANIAPMMIETYYGIFSGGKLTEAEEDWLYANEPDYRNLLNEYHDGSLLYEVSLKKVWNKASEDTAGLEKYFEDHRDNYTWTSPKVKGIIVSAVNDSVAKTAISYMAKVSQDSIFPGVKKEFGKKVKLERFVVGKGGNPIVDRLYYGLDTKQPEGGAYPSVMLYNPRELSNPEEVSDVRGQVVSDYQNELEKEWIAELEKKYPVKVNKKELKKVK